MLLKGLTVLVCEDEPLIAMEVQDELTAAHATVLLAHSLRDGFAVPAPSASMRRCSISSWAKTIAHPSSKSFAHAACPSLFTRASQQTGMTLACSPSRWLRVFSCATLRRCWRSRVPADHGMPNA